MYQNSSSWLRDIVLQKINKQPSSMRCCRNLNNECEYYTCSDDKGDIYKNFEKVFIHFKTLIFIYHLPFHSCSAYFLTNYIIKFHEIIIIFSWSRETKVAQRNSVKNLERSISSANMHIFWTQRFSKKLIDLEVYILNLSVIQFDL